MENRLPAGPFKVSKDLICLVRAAGASFNSSLF